MSRRGDVAELPLFADDATLRRLVAPHMTAGEWKAALEAMEARESFPRIDAQMGGRYLPAVRQFFAHKHGMVDSPPLVPDQKEDPDAWKNFRKRHRRA